MYRVGAEGTVDRARQSYFGIFLLFILGGYALFGRGFAYIGVPPVFIGEIGLFFAVLTLLYRFHSGLLRSAVSWLIGLFMLWGAICTLPYLGEHGIDALRDGVVWGYAIYALAVATVLIRFRVIEKAVELYGRGLPVFLLLAPVILAVFWSAEESIPRWPWGPDGGVGIVHVKAGDIAVHYAGIAAFVVLGLAPSLMKTRWMVLWLVGVAPVIFLSRGAFLTVALVLLLLALLRPTRHYSALVAIALLGLGLFYLTGVEIDPGLESGRVISVGQFFENLGSIFFPSEGASQGLQGTRTWRELWWNRIVDYTVFGEFFWTGKGFGINLADADGFQIDGNLRSPHNIHLTVLARAGVPGLLVWAALNIAFGFALLRNFIRDRRLNRVRLAHMELWTLLYWLAFLVNGTFDVFLEGPQGGIWFWSVVGFGLALILTHRETAATPHAVEPQNRAPAGP